MKKKVLFATVAALFPWLLALDVKLTTLGLEWLFPTLAQIPGFGSTILAGMLVAAQVGAVSTWEPEL